MVKQEIKNIDPRKLKKAKKLFALLELIGITEKDFELLGDIPQLKKDIAEFKEWKEEQIRVQRNEANNVDGKIGKIQEALKRQAFNKKVEEFDFNGERN